MITTNSSGGALSAAYESYVSGGSRQWDAKLLLNGVELECDIMSVTVTKGSSGTDAFTIGNVIGSSLTAVVKNLDTPVKGQEIEYQIGLYTGSGYEYITVGAFTVSESHKAHYQTTIKGYSSIVSDTKGYLDAAALSTPTSIAEIAAVVSRQTGRTITFDAGISDSLQIEGSLSGLSIYQALQIIATCSGGYMINTPDGNIAVKKFDATPTHSVDAERMLSLPTFAEEPFEIASVFCLAKESATDSTGKETSIGYGYGHDVLEGMHYGSVYVITDENDSPIDITTANENSDVSFKSPYVSRDIFDSNIKYIVGYEFTPANIELALGDPRIEGDDVLAVTDTDGAVYVVPCHSIIHKYDGGLTTAIETSSASAKQNTIGTVSPITSQLQNLEKNAAGAINNANYFWHTDVGADSGAHITEIPREDFIKDPENGGGNLLATSRGINVRDGLTDLASFGADASIVGKETDTHMRITPRAMNLRDGKGTSYLFAGVYNDAQGLANVQISYNAGTTEFTTTLHAVAITSATYADDSEATVSISDDGYSFIVSNIKNQVLTIHYVTDSPAPYYTFGRRRSGTIGFFSTTSGLNNLGGGWASICTGENNSIKNQARASALIGGQRNVVEERGYRAVVLGGADNVGSGWDSLTQGMGSKAQGRYQTVLGCYNVPSGTQDDISATDNLFIIGNGSSDTARSNAVTVKWTGNTTIAGTLTQSSDKRLKDHINYLEEDADEFIRNLKPAYYRKDDQNHVGFYAQDVEAIDTWKCMTGEMNGFMTLGYTELIAPLVRYCQHLEERIAELEKGKE